MRSGAEVTVSTTKTHSQINYSSSSKSNGFRPDSFIFKSLKTNSSSSRSEHTVVGANMKSGGGTSHITMTKMCQGTVTSLKQLQRQKKMLQARSRRRQLEAQNKSQKRRRKRPATAATARRRNSDGSGRGKKKKTSCSDVEDYSDSDTGSDNTPELDNDWDPEKEEEEEEEIEEEEIEEAVLTDSEANVEAGQNGYKNGHVEESEDSESDSDSDAPPDLSVGVAKRKRERARTTVAYVQVDRIENGRSVPTLVRKKVYARNDVNYAESSDSEIDNENMQQQQNGEVSARDRKKQKTDTNSTSTKAIGRDKLPAFLRHVKSKWEAREALQARYEFDFRNVFYITTLKHSDPELYQKLIRSHTSDALSKIGASDPSHATLIQSLSHWRQMRGGLLYAIATSIQQQELDHVMNVISALKGSEHVFTESLEQHLQKCRGLSREAAAEAVVRSSELCCYISKRRLDFENGRVVHIRLPQVSLELHHGASASKTSDDNIYNIHKEHESYVLDQWSFDRFFDYFSTLYAKIADTAAAAGLAVDGKKVMTMKDGQFIRQLLTEHDTNFSSLAYCWGLAPNPIDYGMYQKAMTTVKQVLEQEGL